MCVPRFALAMVLAFALGCGNKPEPPQNNPAAKPDSYTIKLRDPEAGDKLEVTQSQSTTSEFYIVMTKATQKKTIATRAQFTETILEKPADATQATKLTRHYQVAEVSESAGKPEVALRAVLGTWAVAQSTWPTDFQGKTVTIAKNAPGARPRYSYKTEDGKDVRLFDTVLFEHEGHFRIQEVLPTSAVKVGEPWTVEPLGAFKLFANLGIANPDPAASSVTGQLLKVYERDGQEWGDIRITLKAKDSEGDGTGQIDVEAPIDGSSLARTQRLTFSATLPKWDGSTKLSITETRKPLK